jgi:HAE1 family hydrophobic/amphiphilic exporter-1
MGPAHPRGHPRFAYTRPRVTFPNALGGAKPSLPSAACCSAPTWTNLFALAKQVNQEMPGSLVVDVKVNLNLNNPELQVAIDRTRASDLGVRVSDIARAVRLLMSGDDEISTYKEGSEQYPVTMRLMPGQRDDPAVLSRILVPSARLGLIRLDSVARLERGLGPSRIDRFNRQFAVSLYGNVAQGYNLDRAAADTQAAVDRDGPASRLPPGFLRPGARCSKRPQPT